MDNHFDLLSAISQLFDARSSEQRQFDVLERPR